MIVAKHNRNSMFFFHVVDGVPQCFIRYVLNCTVLHCWSSANMQNSTENLLQAFMSRAMLESGAAKIDRNRKQPGFQTRRAMKRIQCAQSRQERFLSNILCF